MTNYVNVETLTYNPDAVDSDTQLVRLAIGDTESESGVRPSGRNFSDTELAAFITAAGSWLKAVPLVLQTLATEFAVAGRRALLSPDVEMVKTADQYARIAAELRLQAREAATSLAAIDDADLTDAQSSALAYGDTLVEDSYFALPPLGVR